MNEISNPLSALLDARTQAIKEIACTEDETAIIFLAEAASRTLRDCNWMQIRFSNEAKDVNLKSWIETVVRPISENFSEVLCSKTKSISALAQIQKLIKERIQINLSSEGSEDSIEQHKASQADFEKKVIDDVETLFSQLFGTHFQKRSLYLLETAYESVLKRVKKTLLQQVGMEKKNQIAFKAFAILEKGINLIGKDSQELYGQALTETKTWLNELVTWLEQRPTAVNARFSESVLDYLPGLDNEIKNRLSEFDEKAIQIWVEQTITRLNEDFETGATTLPWSKEGRNGTIAVGGWISDDVHGDLPSVPSWPTSEFCFAIARELDLFTVSNSLPSSRPIHHESDLRCRKLIGEQAWRKMHSVFTNLAQTSSGADGKLQAAFDLEYAVSALIGLDARAPQPFTKGGVDVHACIEVLRMRAKSFASSSRLLHSSFVLQSRKPEAVHEIKVGGHTLLNVVDPVPRFALLPVPQKRGNSPRLTRTSSNQPSVQELSTSDVKQQASKASAAMGGLERVFGLIKF